MIASLMHLKTLQNAFKISKNTTKISDIQYVSKTLKIYKLINLYYKYD